MQDTVVISGDMSLLNVISGEAALLNVIDGECGDFIPVDAHETYTGSYEVTPSSELQTLETADRILIENLVINPIPNNYGLITWNGSVLTVS